LGRHAEGRQDALQAVQRDPDDKRFGECLNQFDAVLSQQSSAGNGP
jgi:hypothetical protein